VSRCAEFPEPSDWSTENGRKIATDKPIYPAADVLGVLNRGVVAARLFTIDSGVDVANHGLSLKDVVELLKDAVQDGIYKGSQWCRQAPKGPIAACDAYMIKRYEVTGHHRRSIKYYLKFAIDRSGNLLLIFSCHPS
jgi:hypothetical protein